ncbi:LysR substrate-binding domain-containing protein [Aestuariispira ectoiniformans]|uniref:LysR substrate-binding domain-containing protein n=1 Tax=Aestuariispira ectoiniformans TaxID=2775080 RepID=UPI00223AC801|nr:LysR substrate-binding domain-containing protein [Aestuariispira ectoiniformans]
MKNRFPSLTHLRCFERAARHQSFTAAAEELRMTQSAVSKKIRELEVDLGVDLFRRVGRGVALTQAGKSFAADLEHDLSSIQNSIQKVISSGNDKVTLSIATLPTFANRWLIPRLPAFLAGNPEIEVNFSTRLDPFEFERDPFDLAIHYGLQNWPNTKMTHLFGEKMVPVCSPAFFDQYGLGTLENITDVPLLHLQSRPDVWQDWFREAAIAGVVRREGRYFDQYSMIITAAIASLGAALIPVAMITRELQDKQLVQITGPALTTEKSYYLVRPHGKAGEHIQKFESWLKKEAGNT